MRFALLGALALVCAAPVGAAVVVDRTGTITQRGWNYFGLNLMEGMYQIELTTSAPLPIGAGGAAVIYKHFHDYCRDFAGGPKYDCGGNDGESLTLLDHPSASKWVAQVTVLPAFGDPDSEELFFRVGDHTLRRVEFFIFTLPESVDYRLTVNSVPEPLTWSIMILGFGLVGAQLRRQPRYEKLSHAPRC